MIPEKPASPFSPKQLSRSGAEHTTPAAPASEPISPERHCAAARPELRPIAEYLKAFDKQLKP